MAKIQSRDVRDAFLAQGPELMNRLINYASGFEVLEDGSRGDFNGEIEPDILLQLTNKLIPMMSLEDDQREAKEIEAAKAKTIEELMDLHSKGFLSDKQLKMYTDTLKTNYEITELNQLLERLDHYEGK